MYRPEPQASLVELLFLINVLIQPSGLRGPLLTAIFFGTFTLPTLEKFMRRVRLPLSVPVPVPHRLACLCLCLFLPSLNLSQPAFAKLLSQPACACLSDAYLFTSYTNFHIDIVNLMFVIHYTKIFTLECCCLFFKISSHFYLFCKNKYPYFCLTVNFH